MIGGVHRGLTWDHPRGYNALAAAAEAAPRDGHPRLVWDKQPLEGFESHPIGDLAGRYDLLVLDHPHLGEAVALDCLTPLEDVFSAADLAAWRAATVGAAMTSYCWADRHWALPLDVATQVAACRPDLLDGAVPDLWEDVARLSEKHSVALSLAGPHAILAFFSLCLSLGEDPGGDDLVGDATAREAFSILTSLFARAPRGTERLNPIGLLEAMARGDAIAFVPLVYGYVNYAAPASGRKRVVFADAPAAATGGRRGSVLGGTGIAVTRRARPDAALVDHLRWLMSDAAQTRFIPDHDGQPSRRDAWTDQAVNGRWGGFYGGTIETVEQAWVRPRFDGYIAFQTAASAAVREALSDGTGGPAAIGKLRALWRAALAAARGPLT